MRSNLRAACTALPLLALIACADEIAPAGLTAAPAVPEGAVQAMIQQAPGPDVGTTLYTVRVISRDRTFAAYQGVLTFTPGSIEVIRTTTPAGTEGETHLVNATEAAAGRIRFAAYAPERFASDEAFSIVVRTHGALADMQLAAALDVAGQAEGTAYATSALRRSVGVMDRSGRQLIGPR